MRAIRLKRKITPPPAPQSTIILQCLAEAYPGGLSLDQLMSACESRGYARRLKPNTDMRESILWHLKRIADVEPFSN